MMSTANKERVVACILSLLGIGSLVWALTAGPSPQVRTNDLLLAALFMGGIVLADFFPIHVLRGTKVILINLPIFLSTVLLPTPLAIFTTGVGLLISNLRARAERGLLPRDIAANIGQWMFITFLGNQIIQLSTAGASGTLRRDIFLIPCALTLLLGDTVLFSISQAFVFGDSFLSFIKSLIKESITLELTQYSIAVLGAMAAYENRWSLIMLLLPIAITYVAFKSLKETRLETLQILQDMADTVDLRDVYTGGHSKRVADLVSQILIQMNISGPEATLIEIAARLHDIGKIGIPDSILKKPGRLSPEEMAVMKTHPDQGAELISKYKDFSRGAQMIRHHHERWDGKGYPAGLKAHDIPFGARVIAVADSLDAMTSDRPYRGALSIDEALQVLQDGMDKQWDSRIVSILIDMLQHQTTDERTKSTFSQPSERSQASPQNTIP